MKKETTVKGAEVAKKKRKIQTPKKVEPPARRPETPSEDAELVDLLINEPIFVDRPVPTESISEDIVQKMVEAVREIITNRLEATDRHLTHRTVWAIANQEAKLNRMDALMDIAIQSALRLPTTVGSPLEIPDLGLIRQNIVRSIRAVHTLLKEFGGDQRKQSEGIELDIRRILSASELFYGDGPSEEEIEEVTIARAIAQKSEVDGSNSKTDVGEKERIAPETILRPPKATTPLLVDAHQNALPGPQYLSEEDRERALKDVARGLKPGKIAKKYRIKVRTVKAWIERHGRKKPKERKVA